MRTGKKVRETGETRVRVELNLDGQGTATIATGVGFLDHMLTLLARHAAIDLAIEAEGDLHIDAHHTVEDVGIALGQALNAALNPPEGIRRYGHAVVPMDETLAEAAVDVSGRPFLVFNAALSSPTVGTFDTELVEEFFRALAMNARMTLHLNLRYGSNTHHQIEGLFKACARAVRMALETDPRMPGTPSTKGLLET